MNLHEEWERNLYKEDKRSQRKERRQITAKDRSKYKKSDQDKLSTEAKPPEGDFERGRILSITPEGAHVQSGDDSFICQLRGVLKKEKGRDKNLITVGDWVLFEKLEDNEGQIVYVEPRFSILSRADNLSRRKQQLIAANIDQVLITASYDEPLFKPVLIDRYLIAAAKGGMKGIIVLNKMDLFDDASEESQEFFDDFLEAYENAGYTVIPTSTKTGDGIDRLKEEMRDKTSVFSGQSGVGKTSLINAVTGLNMRTREVVERTKKGAHTTTYASLIPLEFGGLCIDTPGIKSFGIWDLKPEELGSFYPDIEAFKSDCHFPNCTHTHESDCGVIKAVEEDQLSPIRYEAYQMLLEDLGEEHLRR
ncbi:MAG: ribosome small subunit-dependent GTPase A [Chlamydiia bacterium]|nr:ribosome small subunit-dependent GTPase A [Chlamydiia bacterium]